MARRPLIASCSGRLTALRAPCASAALLVLACAPDRDLPTPSRELTFSGEGHLQVLDNGLTLFVAPDPYTRLVQLDMRVQVGHRDDPSDRQGIAHLVEHLMFDLPSDGPGSPTLGADASRHALWFNAYTGMDHTHYIHVIGAEGLEPIIRHTAQRLSFECESLTAEAFAREREVVRNEMRWRTGGVDDEIGRAGFFLDELAALDDLTPGDVHALGQRLFARERALVVELVPNGKEIETERADLDYEPADDDALVLLEDIDPGEARRPLTFDEVAPPDLQQLDYRLDNGMRVLLVRSSRFPVMDAQVIVGAGLLDAPEHPELPLLAAQLYGTHEGGRFGSSRDAKALLQLFVQSGAELQLRVDPRSTTYRASGLSIYLDFIMAGLGERVVQGEYQSGTFDPWKEAYGELLEQPELVRARANELARAQALFGPGHPHVYAEAGELEALRRLRHRDVWRFHDEQYRAANCTLVIVGGFDMELATTYVEAFFGSPRLRRRQSRWQEPQVEHVRPPVPAPAPTPTVFTSTSEDWVQTSVTVAFPLAEIYGDDHAALAVLAKMAEHEVGAVRERLGASYGVHVALPEDRPRLELSGSVDSERSGEAVAEVLTALERVRASEGFERRFAYARRRAFGELRRAQGDATLLADALAHAVRNGRSYDYHRELAQRIATLTPEDLRGLIGRVLDPGRAVISLEGPPDGVKQAVEHNRLEGVKVLFEDQDEDQ